MKKARLDALFSDTSSSNDNTSRSTISIDIETAATEDEAVALDRNNNRRKHADSDSDSWASDSSSEFDPEYIKLRQEMSHEEELQMKYLSLLKNNPNHPVNSIDFSSMRPQFLHASSMFDKDFIDSYLLAVGHLRRDEDLVQRAASRASDLGMKLTRVDPLIKNQEGDDLDFDRNMNVIGKEGLRLRKSKVAPAPTKERKGVKIKEVNEVKKTERIIQPKSKPKPNQNKKSKDNPNTRRKQQNERNDDRRDLNQGDEDRRARNQRDPNRRDANQRVENQRHQLQKPPNSKRPKKLGAGKKKTKLTEEERERRKNELWQIEQEIITRRNSLLRLKAEREDLRTDVVLLARTVAHLREEEIFRQRRLKQQLLTDREREVHRRKHPYDDEKRTKEKRLFRKLQSRQREKHLKQLKENRRKRKASRHTRGHGHRRRRHRTRKWDRPILRARSGDTNIQKSIQKIKEWKISTAKHGFSESDVVALDRQFMAHRSSRSSKGKEEGGDGEGEETGGSGRRISGRHGRHGRHRHGNHGHGKHRHMRSKKPSDDGFKVIHKAGEPTEKSKNVLERKRKGLAQVDPYMYRSDSNSADHHLDAPERNDEWLELSSSDAEQHELYIKKLGKKKLPWMEIMLDFESQRLIQTLKPFFIALKFSGRLFFFLDKNIFNGLVMLKMDRSNLAVFEISSALLWVSMVFVLMGMTDVFFFSSASDTVYHNYRYIEEIESDKYLLFVLYIMISLTIAAVGSLTTLLRDGIYIVNFINTLMGGNSNMEMSGTSGVRLACILNLCLFLIVAAILILSFMLNWPPHMREGHGLFAMYLLRSFFSRIRIASDSFIFATQVFGLALHLYAYWCIRCFYAIIQISAVLIQNLAKQWNFRFGLQFKQFAINVKGHFPRLTLGNSNKKVFLQHRMLVGFTRDFGNIFPYFIFMYYIFYLSLFTKILIDMFFYDVVKNVADLNRTESFARHKTPREIWGGFKEEYLKDPYGNYTNINDTHVLPVTMELRLHNRKMEDMISMLFVLILMFIDFIFVTQYVDEATRCVMEGFEFVRRKGLILSESSHDRRLIYSLQWGFERKDPPIITCANMFEVGRRSMIRAVGFAVAIFALYVQISQSTTKAKTRERHDGSLNHTCLHPNIRII